MDGAKGKRSSQSASSVKTADKRTKTVTEDTSFDDNDMSSSSSSSSSGSSSSSSSSRSYEQESGMTSNVMDMSLIPPSMQTMTSQVGGDSFITPTRESKPIDVPYKAVTVPFTPSQFSSLVTSKPKISKAPKAVQIVEQLIPVEINPVAFYKNNVLIMVCMVGTLGYLLRPHIFGKNSDFQRLPAHNGTRMNEISRGNWYALNPSAADLWIETLKNRNLETGGNLKCLRKHNCRASLNGSVDNWDLVIAGDEQDIRREFNSLKVFASEAKLCNTQTNPMRLHAVRIGVIRRQNIETREDGLSIDLYNEWIQAMITNRDAATSNEFEFAESSSSIVDTSL